MCTFQTCCVCASATSSATTATAIPVPTHNNYCCCTHCSVHAIPLGAPTSDVGVLLFIVLSQTAVLDASMGSFNVLDACIPSPKATRAGKNAHVPEETEQNETISPETKRAVLLLLLCHEQTNQIVDIPESGVSRESLRDAVSSFGTAVYIDFSFGVREAWLR